GTAKGPHATPDGKWWMFVGQEERVGFVSGAFDCTNSLAHGAGRGDTGRLALSSVGRESSSVLRTGIEPRCGSRPPCVLANHPVSPLPESRSPAGARRSEF